ncbi:MAG TPA: c-type cytochrome [Candidatus Binatia bacterium]|nr:c-type cytochrome [Candidatus Binatia bacterium]
MRWVLLSLLLAGVAFAAGPVNKAEVERGRQLYLLNCARCHGDSATGDGPDARALEARPPDLRGSEILNAHTDEQLIARIREGQPRLRLVSPTPLRSSETEALEEFLRRIPSIRWPLADPGRALYLSRCDACHGRYGHGDGPALDRSLRAPRDLSDPSFQHQVTDRELALLVRHAKPGMPKLRLRPSEADALPLATFVRLLSPGYELYYRYCVSCHGPHGRSGEAKPGARPRFVFDERYFRSLYAEDLRERIWHMLRGVKPEMPHYETTLTAAEVRAIMTYLRSLPKLPPRSSRGRLGGYNVP